MVKDIFVALSSIAPENQTLLSAFEQKGFKFTLNTSGKRLMAPEVVRMAANAQGIIAGLEPYDAKVLAALPHLKCISRCGVGVDNVDLSIARQRDIAVLNTPDVVITPVAELTVGMIFDLFRRITFHTELMRQKRWERLTGNNIEGKTAGIIGLGRIGKRVAQMLRALGVHVQAYDINPDLDWAKKNSVGLTDIDHLLASSDIVSLHLALNGKDHFCLDKAHFAKMKKGTVLVNVGRGNLIDETALIQALTSGHLSGAALDVYTQEPYQGLLCDLPTVILTPHVATFTHESRLEMERQAVMNVINFFQAHRPGQ